jgi:APA family basic amino acid/polyamine antiporter
MEHDDSRPFGFWTACALVVGGVIGAGIFVMPSQLAPYGWTGVAAWIVGGLGAVAIGLVLSSVAESRPEEPGLIAVIGEVLGPVWGVIVGWGAWVSYWCANAYIALTAARYAGTFWAPLADTPFTRH